MFRVRHGRVTSLASGMPRMILPGPQRALVKPALSVAEGRSLRWFEATLYATLPAQSTHQRRIALDQNRRSDFRRISVLDETPEPRRGGTRTPVLARQPRSRSSNQNASPTLRQRRAKEWND